MIPKNLTNNQALSNINNLGMIKDSLHVPKASPHETKRNRYTMMMLTNAIPTMRNTCDLSRIGVTMLGKLHSTPICIVTTITDKVKVFT
jgi:hypothetical protein